MFREQFHSLVIAFLLWWSRWVRSNLTMNLRILFLQFVGIESCCNVLTEMLGVLLRVDILQLLHIVTNVSAKNFVRMHICLVFIFLVAFALLETRKASLRVRNVQTAIDRAFQRSKHSCASTGPRQSNVQQALEWTANLVVWFPAHIGHLRAKLVAVEFLLARVHFVQFEFLQQTSCQQETSAIKRSVVGQTDIETVTFEFVRVRSAQDLIANHLGRRHLTNNVSVAFAHNESPLWCVVLALVLFDESASQRIIGLAFTTTSHLHFETFVVILVLDQFNITHDELTRPCFRFVLIATKNKGGCLDYMHRAQSAV
mmetsp:Transcript_8879/g.13717  ORF Transcript_8879/g.13717 Transcript_8879/m.13717 type:complete len:314 (-) Transcript_8879:20-961(-)